MRRRAYPSEFLKRLKGVRGKRSKVVVDHILKHGQITSEELQRDYGYDHPPRAVRDVREQGIPIETFYVTSSEGRKIAAYRFGDPSLVRDDVLSGRTVLPKALKQALVARDGSSCSICGLQCDARYLSVDHRVPYEVQGDSRAGTPDSAQFMLLCASCQRAKSWSCEHCPNWREARSIPICMACYWARPLAYKHIALRSIRRIEVVWTDGEVEVFERLRKKAAQARKPMPEYVKAVLEKSLENGTRSGSRAK